MPTTPGLGAAFAAMTTAWLICLGVSLVAGTLLPLGAWAERLGARVDRSDSTVRGRQIITGLLLLAGALLRLPFLDGDPPARLLTYSAAFAADEGVWAFLATEWCQGRNPVGGPEYLAGALSLPYTALQFFSCKLFGVSMGSLRLLSALAGTVLGPLAYVGLRRPLGARAAVAAGGLLASSYLLTMYQRTAMTDGVLVVMLLAVMLLTIRGLESPSGRWWLVGAGAALALTIWTKLSALPLVGGILLVAVLPRWSRSSPWPTRPIWIAVGLLPVVGIAAVVYTTFDPLRAAAATVLDINIPPAPSGIVVWVWRLWQVFDKDTTFLHAPILAVGGVATAVGVWATVARRRVASAALVLAAGWWLATVVMLARQGYFPTRYYLQLTPPLTVLAVAGGGWVWRWLPARSVRAPRLQSLIVALVCAELAFSLWRYGDWLANHETSQRDVGLAIATLAAEDHPNPVVSGPWSSNLALSGGFRPMGFWPREPPMFDRAAAHGATHFLTAGPLPEPLLPKSGPLRLRLRGEFRYFMNYFEPKADLHLYAIDVVTVGY